MGMTLSLEKKEKKNIVKNLKQKKINIKILLSIVYSEKI
jgi:hypothetical protein